MGLGLGLGSGFGLEAGAQYSVPVLGCRAVPREGAAVLGLEGVEGRLPLGRRGEHHKLVTRGQAGQPQRRRHLVRVGVGVGVRVGVRVGVGVRVRVRVQVGLGVRVRVGVRVSHSAGGTDTRCARLDRTIHSKRPVACLVRGRVRGRGRGRPRP